MNNIYVDELAKDCWNCQFLIHDDDCYCEICKKFLNDEDLYVSEDSFEHKKAECCPLKSLKDALAEERKKVVQEIRDKISDGIYQNSYGETFIDGDIYEILDQIERGE